MIAQACRIAIGKFVRDSLAVVGNSGTGQTEISLEVFGSHTVVGRRIELKDQAGLDEKFVIETQPAFEGQMGVGVPFGAMDQTEQYQ